MVGRTGRAGRRPTWTFVTTVRLSRSGVGFKCHPGRILGLPRMTAGLAVEDAAGSASVPERQRKPPRWGNRPIGYWPASAGSFFGWGSAAGDGGGYAIAVSRIEVDRAGPVPPARHEKRRPTTCSRGRLGQE